MLLWTLVICFLVFSNACIDAFDDSALSELTIPLLGKDPSTVVLPEQIADSVQFPDSCQTTLLVVPAGNPDIGQLAIEQAQPGDCVWFGPGRHVGNFSSRRDGEPNAPITIAADKDAIIEPLDDSRPVFNIEDSYVELLGLTIVGKAEERTEQSQRSQPAVSTALIEIRASTTRNVKIQSSKLRRSTGACIFLYPGVQNIEVSSNSFDGCYSDAVRIEGDSNSVAGTSQIGNHLIGNNLFKNIGRCIYIDGDITNVSVVQNTCFSPIGFGSNLDDLRPTGIWVLSSSGTIHSNTIYVQAGLGLVVGGSRPEEVSPVDAVSNQITCNFFCKLRVNVDGGDGLINGVGVYLLSGPQGNICGNVFDSIGVDFFGQFAPQLNGNNGCDNVCPSVPQEP